MASTMTDDLSIDRALALAIGWREEYLLNISGLCFVSPEPHDRWRMFDHKDHAVIWPIAERFDCFPIKFGDKWCAGMPTHQIPDLVYHRNPCTAIALAVIAAHGGKA